MARIALDRVVRRATTLRPTYSHPISTELIRLRITATTRTQVLKRSTERALAIRLRDVLGCGGRQTCHFAVRLFDSSAFSLNSFVPSTIETISR